MPPFETTHLYTYLARDGGAIFTYGGQDVSDFTYGSVQLAGTFTGVSVQLQISNDNATWVNFGAALVAAGMTQIDLYSAYIRANATAWATGSFSVILIGKR